MFTWVRLFGIAVFMTAIAAPLAASARTIYTFSIPVQLNGMEPARYQFWCSINGAAIPAQPDVPDLFSPSTFQIKTGSYAGTVSANRIKAATVARTYNCVLYKITVSSMVNPMTGVRQPASFFTTTRVRLSGTAPVTPTPPATVNIKAGTVIYNW
jgi:hypothetical protein